MEPVSKTLFRQSPGGWDLDLPVLTLVFPILGIAKADCQIPSTCFSIANSTLVLPRLTLRLPVLTLVLPILL